MNALTDEEIRTAIDSSGPEGAGALGAVDVHAHFVPEPYRRDLAAAGITKPDGYHGGVPAWTAEQHLDHMGALGIATSIVSISTPGVHLESGPAPADVARRANDAGAELTAAHPGRFGFLASLPVADVDAALVELDRAAGVLGAWGVTLLTHAEGIYLGDPRLEPVLAEISRRELPVLMHPTQPAVLVPGVMEGWSRSMYEYFFDSTRAVLNLVFSGALVRNPGLRLIVPHAGAALPALAQRVARNGWRANRSGAQPPVPDVLESLRSCFFDLAGSVLPHQLPSLLALAEHTNIVYGSDFPFTGGALGAELNADLRRTDLLSIDEKRAFLRDNAAALFPQLTRAPEVAR
jgi:predicted TIM-barrel fold metal-dependent hydrolase